MARKIHCGPSGNPFINCSLGWPVLWQRFTVWLKFLHFMSNHDFLKSCKLCCIYWLFPISHYIFRFTYPLIFNWVRDEKLRPLLVCLLIVICTMISIDDFLKNMGIHPFRPVPAGEVVIVEETGDDFACTVVISQKKNIEMIYFSFLQ